MSATPLRKEMFVFRIETADSHANVFTKYFDVAYFGKNKFMLIKMAVEELKLSYVDGRMT